MKPIDSAPPSRSEDNNRRGPWRRFLEHRHRRFIAITTAIFVFAFSTWWAFEQPVNPDALRPTHLSLRAQLSDPDWWLYPVERHAFLRLPLTNEPVYDEFHLPDTNKVWAVGGGGLVLHSENNGRIWVQQHVPPSEQVQVPTLPGLPTGPEQQERSPRKGDAAPKAKASLDQDGASAPGNHTAHNGVIVAAAFTPPPEKKPGDQTPQLDPKQQSAPANLKDFTLPDKLEPPPANTARDPSSRQQSDPPQLDPSQYAKPSPEASSPGSVGFGVSPPGTPQVGPIAHALIAVHFVNADRGWIVSNAGEIFGTHDGGASWALLSSIRPPNSNYPVIRAARVAFAVDSSGDRGVIALATTGNDPKENYNFLLSYPQYLSTTDGGLSWSPIGDPTPIPNGWDLVDGTLTVGHVAPSTFWLAARNSLWKVDGLGRNQSWKSIWMTKGDFIDSCLQWDSNSLLMMQTRLLTRYDFASNSAVTIDGAQLGLVNNETLLAIAIENPQSAFVYTSHDRIINTVDRGAHWSAGPASSAFVARARLALALGADTRNPIQNFSSSFANGYLTGSRVISTVFENPMWTTANRAGVQRFGWWGRTAICSVPSGQVLSTIDAGATWRIAANPVGYDHRSLDVISERTAFLVSSDGQLWRSKDGGLSWGLVPPPAAAGKFIAAHFSSDQLGWAIIASDAKQGGLYLATDGGQTWKKTRDLTENQLAAAAAIRGRDTETCAVISANRTIEIFASGSATGFALPAVATDAGMGSVFFDRFGRLVVLDAQGRASQITVTPPGDSWSVAEDVTSPSPLFVSPANLRTYPTARVFAPFVLGPTPVRTASAAPFVPFQYTGEAALIAPYRRLPAPWYYISWLVCLTCLGLAFYPAVQIAAKSSISDMGINDAPVEDFRSDLLGLGALARAISFFIRNPETEPPLTIGINAPWGKGKSSLMKLILCDLKRSGFPTVWFNAWHHQTEEHLLASLLDGITKRSAPKLLSSEGLRFRIRLASRRVADLWDSRPLFFSLVIFGAVTWASALAYWYQNPAPPPPRQVAAPPKPTVTNTVTFGNFTHSETLAPQVPPAAESADLIPPTDWTNVGDVLSFVGRYTKKSAPGLATLLTIAAAVLGPLRKLFSTFGVSPAKLLSGQGEGTGAELRAKTSFRAQFSREFEQVTAALGRNRKLVIFIDDLDRCEHDNVAEMLQTANYLVTAGKCVVIMGFDDLYVRTCIEMHYADLIRKRAAMAAKQPDARSRAAKDFAHEYLEKLINIEVPVPDPSSVQTRRLLTPRPPEKLKHWEKWLDRGPRYAARTFAVLAVAAIAALAMHVGYDIIPVNVRDASSKLAINDVDVEDKPPTPRSTKSLESLSPATTSPIVPPAAPVTPVSVEAAKPASTLLSAWAFFLALLAFVSAAVALVATGLDRRKREPITDSNTFVASLNAWFPWIDRTRPTPRVVKRFINRVRFYAMRQRALEYEENPYWWRTSPERSTDDVAIPEPILVALSSAEQYQRARAVQGDPVLSTDELASQTIEEIKTFEGRASLMPEKEEKYRALFADINDASFVRALKENTEKFDAMRSGVGFR